MIKKYTSKEENILLASQLFQLDKIAVNDFTLIETIGDILPGVVLINDMLKMQNSYMSSSGCILFNQSREEINDLGIEYFTSDKFCKDEIKWITHHFGSLAQRNDHDEVTGFYQKVRKSKKHPWRQFYLSGKIVKGHPGSFIYMGLEVNNRSRSVLSFNDQLNIAPINPISFQRFNTLSKREKEILQLIATGYTNKRVADYLSIALFTVETHRKNINTKLGTKTLSELIRISDLFNIY